MPFPRGDEYNLAIQSPPLCFTDAELKACLPELTALGLPKPYSGGFTTTYKLKGARKTWAVRCFTREVPELQFRYAAISKALSQRISSAFVKAKYIEKGIQVNGQFQPVIKMQWIKGDLLNVYIGKNLKKPEKLQKLAADFLLLSKKLEENGIAHGDLQHGNIIVKAGRLYLIDYDGMFVPALSGRKANELGHPNYQHPARDNTFFDEKMDRFSVWVIYLGIMAVSFRPELWKKYDDRENILFRKTDFYEPERSALCKELSHIPEIKALSDAFKAILKLLPEELPVIEPSSFAVGPQLSAEPVSHRPSSALPDWLGDHLPANFNEAENDAPSGGKNGPDLPAFRQLAKERLIFTPFTLAVAAAFVVFNLFWGFVALVLDGLLFIFLYRRQPELKEKQETRRELDLANAEVKRIETQLKETDTKITACKKEIEDLKHKMKFEDAALQTDLLSTENTYRSKLEDLLSEVHYIELATIAGLPYRYLDEELGKLSLKKYVGFSQSLISAGIRNFNDFKGTDQSGGILLKNGNIIHIKGLGEMRSAKLMAARQQATKDLLVKISKGLSLTELYGLLKQTFLTEAQALHLSEENKVQRAQRLSRAENEKESLLKAIIQQNERLNELSRQFSTLRSSASSAAARLDRLKMRAARQERQLSFRNYVKDFLGFS
jgi:hypothetical protein